MSLFLELCTDYLMCMHVQYNIALHLYIPVSKKTKCLNVLWSVRMLLHCDLLKCNYYDTRYSSPRNAMHSSSYCIHEYKYA